MSKNLIIFLILIATLSSGYVYLNRRSSQPLPAEAIKTETNGSVSKVSSLESDNQIQYLPYSKSNLDNSKDQRRVLFFYANWCPTCIPADADFTKNVSMFPPDVTLIRVNYNDPDTDADEKALATKYGITYQHSYVQIDSEGNEITKWNGGATKELLAKIK